MPPLNATQLQTLTAGLRGLNTRRFWDLAQDLQAAGIAPSYGGAALTDPAVLAAVAQDEVLAGRFAGALRPPVAKLIGDYQRVVSGGATPARGRGRRGKPRGISREIVQTLDALRDLQSLLGSMATPTVSPMGPGLFLSAGFYWSEAVRAHFLPVGGPVWKHPSLSAVWRAGRDLNQQVGDARPLSARGLREAGGIWAMALEREGMGRALREEVQETRHVAQILTWLGVKRVPEGRCDRELEPRLIGFKEVNEGRRRERHGGLQPGDLVTLGNPLFASVAVLTKTAPGGYPAEVMMLLGGHLFLGHPKLAGSGPHYWRLTARPPDYLLLTDSPFEDRSIDRILYLDEVLEVEEAIDFPGTRFLVVQKDSWSHLSSDEWVVSTDFADGSFAIFHLTIQRPEGRCLSVVIDYHGGKDQKPLPEFAGVVEASLEGIASRLGFHRVNLFYKMVWPFEGKEGFDRELVEGGYRGIESPGWGRLPGKRITLQSRRR